MYGTSVRRHTQKEKDTCILYAAQSSGRVLNLFSVYYTTVVFLAKTKNKNENAKQNDRLST